MLLANSLNQPKDNSNIPLIPIWLLIAISSIVFIEPAPYDVLGILLIVGYFAAGLRIPPHLSTALVLLTIFLIANVLSAMFTSDPFRCTRYMFITFYLVLTWLFFTSVIYNDPERVYNTILNAYLFAAVIAVILGVIGYLKLTSFYELFLSYDRVKGPFKDENVFGPYLIPPILYLVFKLEGAQLNQFILKLTLLLFLTLGILLSFSRGAWFNLLISAFIYGVLRLMTARSNRDVSGLMMIGGIVLIASVSFITWAVTSTDIAEVFFRRARLFQKYDVGTGGRFSTLKIVVEQIFQNPIGIGPGESKYSLSLDPHNLYIHITSETGWLGGVAFCSFLIISVWQGFLFSMSRSKLQGLYIIVFACVLATLIQSMLIHSTHWRHLYLLLAMLWGPMIAKEKLAVEAQEHL